MKEFNEEQFNQDFAEFWGNMEKCGVDKKFDEIKLKNSLKTAPGLLNEDSGCAYPGGLLRHIVLSTAIAKKLLKMVSGVFDVEEESMVKIMSLMHLSKIQMFKPNDNDWEVKNRGLNYKFAELQGRLKFGERTILLLMNKGISLKPEEFEAIRSTDKESEEPSSKAFDSIYSVIARHSNELAYNIEKEQYRKNK